MPGYPELTILGIDTGELGDTVGTVERFIEQNGIEFEVVFDEGSYGLYAWDFGLSPYPRRAGDRPAGRRVRAHLRGRAP